MVNFDELHPLTIHVITTLFTFPFQKLRTVKSSHDQVLNEMERLNHQLKEEQNKVLKANNELKSGTANQRRMVEVTAI